MEIPIRYQVLNSEDITIVDALININEVENLKIVKYMKPI